MASVDFASRGCWKVKGLLCERESCSCRLGLPKVSAGPNLAIRGPIIKQIVVYVWS